MGRGRRRGLAAGRRGESKPSATCAFHRRWSRVVAIATSSSASGIVVVVVAKNVASSNSPSGGTATAAPSGGRSSRGPVRNRESCGNRGAGGARAGGRGCACSHRGGNGDGWAKVSCKSKDLRLCVARTHVHRKPAVNKTVGCRDLEREADMK